jgi:predicted molibdopterin-dependent oxidoreductase YjgC
MAGTGSLAAVSATSQRCAFCSQPELIVGQLCPPILKAVANAGETILRASNDSNSQDQDCGRTNGAKVGAVATVCGYCGVGCGMHLHVADGVVTKATGRADHPANRGRLCTKGNTTAEMLRAGGRLTTAMVRSRREAEPDPMDADAAVKMVAARLSAIRDEHGADAIALYVSGQMSI